MANWIDGCAQIPAMFCRGRFLTFGNNLGYVFQGVFLGGLLETVVFQTMAVDASVSYGDESPPFWV